MKTVRDVCSYIGSVVQPSPICVETGCTYVVDKENLIHTTTNNLYEFVVLMNEGYLFSLDIDPEHIVFAKGLLTGYPSDDPAYEFLEGDSVTQMTFLSKRLRDNGFEVSVLCLDSKEFDEWHMLAEYDAIKGVLAERHFVLVDDVHNPNSVKYKQMVPELKKLGYQYVEVPTPTGMFVAAKGYELPEV